ncbi:hypothetical protein DFS34DRAFT_645412 [Phlyctochytrium arcticum]|nr:hypothetical protein DFS34DRAFT_645412 [Phlyctochytrium arcticum]
MPKIYRTLSINFSDYENDPYPVLPPKRSKVQGDEFMEEQANDRTRTFCILCSQSIPKKTQHVRAHIQSRRHRNNIRTARREQAEVPHQSVDNEPENSQTIDIVSEVFPAEDLHDVDPARLQQDFEERREDQELAAFCNGAASSVQQEIPKHDVLRFARDVNKTCRNPELSLTFPNKMRLGRVEKRLTDIRKHVQQTYKSLGL